MHTKIAFLATFYGVYRRIGLAFLGVVCTDFALSAYAAYVPSTSTLPMLGLGAFMPWQGDWGLNMQWRRKWLDSAIRRSPLVHTSTQDTAYLALTHSFK